MARLLLDEMLTPKIAQQLHDRGHDTLAVTERPDLVSARDEVVLEIATLEERVLVTVNVADFAALDATWAALGRSHSGMVFITSSAFPQDRSFIGAVVRALDAASRGGSLPASTEARYLRRPLDG